MLLAGNGSSEPSAGVVLDLPTCPNSPCPGNSDGASIIRCQIANGYWCPLLSFAAVHPGGMSGPVLQGLSDRWHSDADQRSSVCSEGYEGTGQRLVLVPLVIPPRGGRSQAVPRGFAQFFLRNLPEAPQDDLVAEFITLVNAGTGGGDSLLANDSKLPGIPTSLGPMREDSHGPGQDPEPLPACVQPNLQQPAAVSAAARALFFPPIPNPARGSTRFHFSLPRPAWVVLAVYDASGREVRGLVRGMRGAGVHSEVWDGRNSRGERASAGLYFARVSIDGVARLQRVVILQ